MLGDAGSRHAGTGVGGSFAVSCTPGFASLFLCIHIGEFQQRYPDVALKVLTQYHEATGDPRALNLMERYFRFQLAQLPTQPLAMWAAPRGQEQLLPMLYLYRKTGTDDLASLAALLRAQSYDWGAIFRNFPYQKTTHAYLNRPLFLAAKRITLMQDWTTKRLKKARIRQGKPTVPHNPGDYDGDLFGGAA